MQAEVYCLLLLLFAVCVGAQTIKIHDLEKKNINSSCETGTGMIPEMISEMDRYVLHADVDLMYGSERWSKIILFQIKNSDSSQFVQLCLLNLDNGCQDSYCSCEKKPTTDQTTFSIIINITAFVDNSEAEIRGVLTNVNKIQMYSNTVKLPAIYDLSKRMLQVNNLTISPNQSSYQLKQTDRRIEFCCLNTPTPCVTTVVANQNVTTSGDRCTVIDVPLDAGYDNVTIVTSVCYKYNFTRVIILQTENIASTPNQTNNTNVCTKIETLESVATLAAFHYKLIFVIPAALIVLIPVIVITVCRVFRKQFKSETFLRNNEEEESKNKFITEKENKKKLYSVEAADSDSEKSLMKAVHLKTPPSEDNSDQVNSYTITLGGAARTATTMPENMSAV